MAWDQRRTAAIEDHVIFYLCLSLLKKYPPPVLERDQISFCCISVVVGYLTSQATIFLLTSALPHAVFESGNSQNL